ncbi:MAG: PilZ domain-containing protein, partial [Sandaracinaceae bacterium]|nr:PilZ domain-containing protein [Sandaracinaceae bacterium]
MQAGIESVERREHPRFDLGVTARLFQRGAALGRFAVQNLSAGGALLTGAHEVRRSAPLRLVLEMPDGSMLTVGGHVTRSARNESLVALAIAFRHLDAGSEDRIQDAILQRLDHGFRATHPAVLVVDREHERRERLAQRARASGRRVSTSEAPLGALSILDDPGEHVDTLVVPLSMRERGAELLALVAESYPAVHPVRVVDEDGDPGAPSARV